MERARFQNRPASFLLSGVGATLWVRHLTGSLAGGIVAGLIWAFAPGKFDQLPHLHMMAGQWIPFALLFCSRYVESGRGRYLYATAAFAGLQFAFSMHYGVFLLPILALVGASETKDDCRQPDEDRHATRRVGHAQPAGRHTDSSGKRD